ncbi:MAG: hypothetical protein HQK51_09690 [Oligoflexia bacterium]|nr:hypothetical protein [Oligoflexia bacterium]
MKRLSLLVFLFVSIFFVRSEFSRAEDLIGAILGSISKTGEFISKNPQFATNLLYFTVYLGGTGLTAPSGSLTWGTGSISQVFSKSVYNLSKALGDKEFEDTQIGRGLEGVKGFGSDMIQFGFQWQKDTYIWHYGPFCHHCH